MGWSDATAGPEAPGRLTLAGIPRSEPPIVQKDEALASTVRQPADSSSPRESLAATLAPPGFQSNLERRRRLPHTCHTPLLGSARWGSACTLGGSTPAPTGGREDQRRWNERVRSHAH